eukprot:8433931-Karenia_brevis.AAC.1
MRSASIKDLDRAARSDETCSAGTCSRFKSVPGSLGSGTELGMGVNAEASSSDCMLPVSNSSKAFSSTS